MHLVQTPYTHPAGWKDACIKLGEWKNVLSRGVFAIRLFERYTRIFSDYVAHQPAPLSAAWKRGGRRCCTAENPLGNFLVSGRGLFWQGQGLFKLLRARQPLRSERGKQKTFITAVFRWLGEQVEQDFRVIPAAPCLLLVPTRIFIRNGLSGAYPTRRTRPLLRPFFTFFHFFLFSFYLFFFQTRFCASII